MTSFRCTVAFFLGLVLPLAAQVPPRLVYHVTVKEGDAAAFHHALEIHRPDTQDVRLSVAAWAPGSYRLMNVFQNIVDVAAVDERGGARAVKKDGDLTWIVDARGVATLRVSWRFQDPGKSVNNRSYLNQTAGLIDGPRNYLYWRDHKDLPAHVHFHLPKAWRVATGLTATFDPMVFVADDADWLLDCPVLVGKIESWTFDLGGVPHRIALDNRDKPVEFDAAAFLENVRKITATAAEIWDEIPYRHYTYIFNAGGGGGLEHLTSTTIGVSPRALATNPAAHEGVIAHELFHAWNVKRLRPKTLGPFDYDGPVRTKSLWISEGITNYYTNVILARAGLVSQEEFIATYGETIGGFIATPASRTISPEEASWTVWDSPYMGGPISYYTQGEILGLLMDLEIRGRSGNERSLDDAMKLLYRRHSGKTGFQSEDVVSAILDATGVDLHEFFLKHVSGARDIDWQRYFRYMGCIGRSAKRLRTAIALEVVQGGNDGVTVRIADDSSLARVGLRSSDVVVAINGAKVTSGRALLDALRGLEVGAPLEIGARRGAETVTLKGAVEAALDVVELFGRRGGARLTVGRLPGDSEFARSGLADGDVVKAVNGSAVTTRDEYRAASSKVREGEVVKLTVERSGAQHVIEHRASPSVTTTFELRLDPSASPLEIAIRQGIIMGTKAAAVESRPARKAG